MAKIVSLININGVDVEFNFKLEGQQLYFFEQGSNAEKIRWVKSVLKDTVKLKSVKIVDKT